MSMPPTIIAKPRATTKPANIISPRITRTLRAVITITQCITLPKLPRPTSSTTANPPKPPTAKRRVSPILSGAARSLVNLCAPPQKKVLPLRTPRGSVLDSWFFSPATNEFRVTLSLRPTRSTIFMSSDCFLHPPPTTHPLSPNFHFLFSIFRFPRDAIVLVLLVCLSTPAQSPIIQTHLGPIQGALEGKILSFKGIPYASPPVGLFRWREPQLAQPWQSPRPTTQFGNACMQTPGLSEANGGNPGPISEDCLYLNVWTPRAESSAKLPVLVWIHGGAFVFGSGSLDIYNGAPLAAKGIVVVTINYRLGALGFFAHPALEKESSTAAPINNFALLDQIAALQWVQRNIAQFGGNASNVTIVGQSAGAKSVLALFASPLARGLFHKGVALSSYGLPDATRTRAATVAGNIADALGLPGVSSATLAMIPA